MRKALIAVLCGLILLLGAFFSFPRSAWERTFGRSASASGPEPNDSFETTLPPLPPEATSEQVHALCGKCHAYPPADSFPKSAWRREVKGGYDFFRDSKLQLDYPSLESVVQYYEKRAPEELPPNDSHISFDPAPVRFQQRGFALPSSRSPTGASGGAAVTNVNVGHLFDKKKLDILVCDMRPGRILALRPYLTPPAWHTIAELGSRAAPAHAEVVDLDGDGILDVLVANLGSFSPTDDLVGSVIWLRGRPDGTFTPITLLQGVGRVADVQAADFKGTGKLDLVVGVFGWRNTGEILYLENRTTDWDHPVFVPHVLDDRHGTIHVPVCDLNQDGKPDFVALISQEHETIVAFLNEGDGRFHKEIIYTAPHPAYGSSGIQVVDLNGDGKLDVLYTNGDTLDPPYTLKPYHGVQWLENQGKFPFAHHPLVPMYGAMRAVAADFRGSGLKDIVAVSYLPEEIFPQRRPLRLDSVLYLEQTKPGKFVPYSMEQVRCDYLTAVAGDLNGDGRNHLIIGSHSLNPDYTPPSALSIWENQGRQGKTGGNRENRE
jgi:hypothetical protein